MDRPLTNPAAADLTPRPKRQLVSLSRNMIPLAPRPEPNPQLKLPTPETNQWQERWGNFYNRLKRRELEVELMPFWRTPATAFAVVSSVSVFLLMFLIGLLRFGYFPPLIPFYYNAIDAKWEQADKSIILFLPILQGVVNGILIKFIYDIFKYDHRLSNVLSWVITVVNLLTLIAAAEIYSLTQPR